jgi:hypothetical protein
VLGDLLGIPGGKNPIKDTFKYGDSSSSALRKGDVKFGPITMNSSYKTAEDVIKKLAGNVYMTPEEKSAFLAVIVVHCVGTFLARPHRNITEVEECVMDAICGEHSIDSYDWQGYTLRSLVWFVWR